MWSFVYVNDPEGWGGFKILTLGCAMSAFLNRMSLQNVM